MELTIQIQLPPTYPTLPQAFWTPAKTAALRLLADADKPDAEISVVLCDDARIHALNREWRNKDAPTDVLSWPLIEEGGEDVAPGQENELGDVVISLDTAQKQAHARGWTVEEEVALLLVHGILHLLGYEDDTLAGSKRMQAIETRILGKPLDKVDTAKISSESVPSTGTMNP